MKAFFLDASSVRAKSGSSTYLLALHGGSIQQLIGHLIDDLRCLPPDSEEEINYRCENKTEMPYQSLSARV
jgi:hypothetical protein